jgi:hypothetical protein
MNWVVLGKALKAYAIVVVGIVSIFGLMWFTMSLFMYLFGRPGTLILPFIMVSGFVIYGFYMSYLDKNDY